MITLQKVLKQDSAQNAPDARREISEERGVLGVRRSDEDVEATQEMEYLEQNHLRNMKNIKVSTMLRSIEVAKGK